MNPYIQLPKVQVVNGRRDVIIKRCGGKKVLHLGCVDAGLLSERFPSGGLMHQQLAAVAGELWGVDVDTEGISFLRGRGFKNLIVGDICELDRIDVLQEKNFDVIVASEVIEHLQNPGLFLNAVKAFMCSGKTELIVTVPNAFRIDTLLWLLRGVEYIHPDHNYWFSYHTATNLLRKSGLAINEVYAYSFQSTEILPRPFKNLFTSNSGLETRRPENANISDGSVSFFKRASAYLCSLPKRLLVSFLYRRTAFWADGIIIMASVAP